MKKFTLITKLAVAMMAMVCITVGCGGEGDESNAPGGSGGSGGSGPSVDKIGFTRTLSNMKFYGYSMDMPRVLAYAVEQHGDGVKEAYNDFQNALKKIDADYNSLATNSLPADETIAQLYEGYLNPLLTDKGFEGTITVNRKINEEDAVTIKTFTFTTKNANPIRFRRGGTNNVKYNDEDAEVALANYNMDVMYFFAALGNADNDFKQFDQANATADDVIAFYSRYLADYLEGKGFSGYLDFMQLDENGVYQEFRLELKK